MGESFFEREGFIKDESVLVYTRRPQPSAASAAAEMLEQMRSIADEMRGYTERIEKAVAGEQLFWTEEDLAEELTRRGVKCSVLTIKRERRAGKIPFKRIAGKPVFARRHLEEFLSK